MPKLSLLWSGKFVNFVKIFQFLKLLFAYLVILHEWVNILLFLNHFKQNFKVFCSSRCSLAVSIAVNVALVQNSKLDRNGPNQKCNNLDHGQPRG